MRKDFSIRLRLSAVEGEEVKRLALAEGKSQTTVLTRLVPDELKFRRDETYAVGELLRYLTSGKAAGK